MFYEADKDFWPTLSQLEWYSTRRREVERKKESGCRPGKEGARATGAINRDGDRRSARPTALTKENDSDARPTHVWYGISALQMQAC